MVRKTKDILERTVLVIFLLALVCGFTYRVSGDLKWHYSNLIYSVGISDGLDMALAMTIIDSASRLLGYGVICIINIAVAVKLMVGGIRRG